MKQINENLIINNVDINNWEYDGDFMMPVAYEVSVTFFQRNYTIYFTPEDIRKFNEGWGLEKSGCEGDSILFDSIDSYFDNNEEDARILIDIIKEAWNDFKGDSPYNYIGMIK